MHYPGLQQTLPIPIEFQRELTMDFITSLPNLRDFVVIWVIIDWFSRYAQFITLAHRILAKKMAHTFFDRINWLLGLPDTFNNYNHSPW